MVTSRWASLLYTDQLKTSRLLQMSWCRIWGRPSATAMLTRLWLYGHTNHIAWHRYNSTEVEWSATRWLLCYWRSRLFTAITCFLAWCRIFALVSRTITDSDNWVIIGSAPSHYLNRWWHIINCIPRNIIRWRLNQNAKMCFTKMWLKISEKCRAIFTGPS